MTNKKSVPTFEGRLYTGEELHGLAGNWVRRAEVDALLDEVEQLRGNLSLAEEGLANYALEVEQLQMRLKRHEPVSLYNGHDIDWWKAEAERMRDALKRVRRVAAEGTTHIGMIAALGILVDRALNPGNGPLPPDYTYRSSEPRVCASRDADHCDYPDCEQHWTHVVAQARALLEPLADCDPAIRQWLKTPDLPKLPGASRAASSGEPCE